jgi:hypothetical protein
MAKVLLGSSSAIALALASDDRVVVTGDTETFYRRHPEIGAAIRCRSWSDLPRVVRDVRESKHGQRFRAGVTELNEARLRDLQRS